jgi:glycosyltransferase involved in cell wall biosynthesis
MNGFREDLRTGIEDFVREQARRFPEDEVLRIDLHCHDRNSDVPDELIGRLLRSPETWVPTDQVVATLERTGVDLITITNHNNARSCFELLDRGRDVLVGAEFTCTVPEEEASVHVLTYGFTPTEELRLNELRRDLYAFRDFTLERNLPAILAHPLFFYSRDASRPAIGLLEKLTLVFDSFEVLNGQRDAWQNLLLIAWLDGLDWDRLDDLSRRTGIAPERFSTRPLNKRMTGGSDCHMAMFCGATGSLLHVPGLPARRHGEALSALALEALREGEAAPFGTYAATERLAAQFLDFFCQAAMNLEDPGLVRMLLHQGTPGEKLAAFAIANGLLELQRHRYTSRFLQAAHEALHGQRPGFLMRRTTSATFRPLVSELDRIALESRRGPEALQRVLGEAVPRLFHLLCEILAGRIARKAAGFGGLEGHTAASAVRAIERLEIPADFLALWGGRPAARRRDMSEVSVADLTDGLPFPLLAAATLAGASFAADRVVFGNRPLLEAIADRTGRHRHPARALWLTDTLFDRNGVASCLRLVLDEARRRDLPIDFAVADGNHENGEHLLALRPLHEFTTPFYEGQPIRVFDPMELSRLFLVGGYDRVICSTELLMGGMGLALKQAYSVPAWFYLHTDWIDFGRRTLGLDQPNLDRLRRILRAFYRSFDGLFVLNRQQREWLASPAMGIPAERIHAAAHWVDERFTPRPVDRAAVFPGLRGDEPVVLFAGRVSREKGVAELAPIMRAVHSRFPRARLAVAGTGPAEGELRAALPEAVCLGWVDVERLAEAYCAADVLVLPSRFDTFGNVVVQALSCGLPAVVYDDKGPRDIVVDGVCGYVAKTPRELAERVCAVLADDEGRGRMRLEARKRAAHFSRERIAGDLLRDLGLDGRPRTSVAPPDAASHAEALPAAL